MNKPISLALATAMLVLAGCHRSGSQASATTAAKPNESVTITQASPPAGGTWALVVNATSDGFMMGNPNAKVKLIEIASLSCPHCKRFEDEGVPPLVDQYVKTGRVSWEFRPYLIHGQIDMPANLIVECNGPKSFFPLTMALYRDQESWMAKLLAVPEAKMAQLQNVPPAEAFTQVAQLAGLPEWAAARGMPQAKTAQCLRDQKQIEHQVQVTSNVNSQFPEFSGTPAFVINGKMLPEDSNTWDKVKPALDAALR